MLETAYAAWHADTRAGRASLLVADTSAAVHALNKRAHADRILAGEVAPGRYLNLADGTEVSAGDQIITHRNKRTETDGEGAWIRNGARRCVTRRGRTRSTTRNRSRRESK